jgi:hypothetical protein
MLLPHITFGVKCPHFGVGGEYPCYKFSVRAILEFVLVQIVVFLIYNCAWPLVILMAFMYSCLPFYVSICSGYAMLTSLLMNRG